jgi:hypothetical protein
MQEHLSIGKSSFNELTKLIDFVNNNIVHIHNSIIEEQKAISYKIPNILY